jgi:hypothetical protein
MSSSIVFVVGPRADGTWYVRRSDEQRPAAIMPTRAEALAVGRGLATDNGGELTITDEVDDMRRRPRLRKRSVA